MKKNETTVGPFRYAILTKKPSGWRGIIHKITGGKFFRGAYFVDYEKKDSNR